MVNILLSYAHNRYLPFLEDVALISRLPIGLHRHMSFRCTWSLALESNTQADFVHHTLNPSNVTFLHYSGFVTWK